MSITEAIIHKNHTWERQLFVQTVCCCCGGGRCGLSDTAEKRCVCPHRTECNVSGTLIYRWQNTWESDSLLLPGQEPTLIGAPGHRPGQVECSSHSSLCTGWRPRSLGHSPEGGDSERSNPPGNTPKGVSPIVGPARCPCSLLADSKLHQPGHPQGS